MIDVACRPELRATLVTIGSMTRVGPVRAARRIAVSCVSNKLGTAQQEADAAEAQRRIGVGDLRDEPGRDTSASISFSPPQSRTRIVTGSPAIVSMMLR